MHHKNSKNILPVYKTFENFELNLAFTLQINETQKSTLLTKYAMFSTTVLIKDWINYF